MTISDDFVVELTQELIHFPTVNPPGNELEIAQFLGHRMASLGLDVELQVIADRRANVLGRLRGQGQGSLVFTGHLDVVPVGEQVWTHPPFDAEIENGRLYGRGSCDMKGGVAAAVTAVGELARAGFRPKGDIVVAATCGEEAGLIGASALVDNQALAGIKHLIVAEPSGLEVFIAEKGALWVGIRAYGKTAHGSMPSFGVNAVSYMARLIVDLEDHPLLSGRSTLLGEPTVSSNLVAGGYTVNVVPDQCDLWLDIRTLPGQSHVDIVEDLELRAREVVERHAPAITIDVQVESEVPSVHVDPDNALVAAIARSVEAVCGRPPRIGGVAFYTDGARLAPGYGIPMVICGPGNPGMAHQPDEYTEIDQLQKSVKIYMDVAHRLLASG